MNGMHNKTQCAGHNCPERKGCLRYVRRLGDDWASLDIERERTQTCPPKIEYEPKAARLRKAA